MTQTLAIFGATGALGKVLVKQAVTRGYTIRILSRRAVDVGAGVHVVQGDYFDPAAIRETLTGSDAVLSTIGPPPTRNPGTTAEDYSAAMKHLIQEMEQLGLSRFVNVASTATRLGAEPYGLGRRLLRLMLKLIAPVIIPAKERELSILSTSGLNWTTVRPPVIKAGRGGTLRVRDATPQGMQVDQDLMARFMLDQLESEEWVGKAPFIGS